MFQTQISFSSAPSAAPHECTVEAVPSAVEATAVAHLFAICTAPIFTQRTSGTPPETASQLSSGSGTINQQSVTDLHQMAAYLYGGGDLSPVSPLSAHQ